MLDDFQTQILNQRLWREVILRNKFSGLIHYGLVIGAFFVCRELYLSNPNAFSSTGLIVVGNIFRAVIMSQISKAPEVTRGHAIFHNACLAIIGFGWSLLWYDIDSFYGRYSVEGVFGLLTLSAIASGAIVPHAPKPLGYVCLSTAIVAVPIALFFSGLDNDKISLALCLTIYSSYCLFQLKAAHRTVKRLIQNDLLVSDEKFKLQTLLNAVPGYVTFIDKDLNYVMVNHEAQTTFRTEIGQSIRKPNPDSPFVNFVTNFMNGDKLMAVTEIEMQLNPGRSMAFVSIQRNQKLNGGAVIVAIAMDELIVAREKVKDQEFKSYHTAKLISLGEMAGGIAHEINNPLAIIMGCSDQIRRLAKKDQPDLLTIALLNEKVQKTVDRIAAIIKSLRILSSDGEKETYKVLKIESILEHAIELSRSRFQEDGVELNISKEEEILCFGQETQLSQVMMNLLSNAFDAATDAPHPRWVKLAIGRAEDFVIISIQDSGKGIIPEIKHKIMEPFFTTKPLNKGTGLGLSISKSIVEQHGGNLYLDEDQTHTTFIVRLKAAE